MEWYAWILLAIAWLIGWGMSADVTLTPTRKRKRKNASACQADAEEK